MKLKNLFMTAAALTACAACTDYDPGLSDSASNLTDEEVATLQAYTTNFVERYGTIDPEQTWGFGDIGSEGSTRSVNMPNNNQWITLNKDNQDDRNLTGITYIDDAATPGFPSAADGLYHIYQSGSPVTKTYNDIVTMVKNGTDEVNPVGDVTDEEILYVSAWFRNHKNPTSDPLDVDHYYVQAISKDYDRTSYASETSLINEGTSSWAEGDGVGTWDENVALNWYKNGVYSTTDPNGNSAVGLTRTESFALDQLAVKADNDADYVHIFNNNAGNTSRISSTTPTAINQTTWSALGTGIVSDQSYRAIMYMRQSGTTDFKAWNSGDPQWDSRWVIKNIKFTGRDGHQYDGWYLAFDIKYYKPNLVTQQMGDDVYSQYAEKDYDGYYSNYIVKITPGTGSITTPDPEPEHNWYRVMCEDLGNTYDFDFNDLVFDVYFTGEAPNYEAHIKVQAAGGTMPIYIGQVDDAHEAHKILGQEETSRAINVGSNRRTPVEASWTWPMSSTNPKDIPIYVTTIQNAATTNITRLPDAGPGSEFAPQKICIPGNTTRWALESKQIEWAYPSFPTWVQNASAAGYNSETPWNTTNVNESYLFK